MNDDYKLWSYNDSKNRLLNFSLWLLGALIFMIAARYIHQQTMWVFVKDSPAAIADYMSRMFPPDLSYFQRVLPALWDTFNIAVFGTLIAAIIALPLSILGAKTTTPNSFTRLLAMIIIVSSRSINSLIWALLFVRIVGPGIFAGMLAISIRSIGMITKLFYEAIEEVNQKPIEAVKSTGANSLIVFLYGYVPQLIPIYLGTVIYRWDINIRESTIVGIVGGGGIGFLLDSAVNRLAWDQVLVVLITILGTVIISEWISAKARASVM